MKRRDFITLLGSAVAAWPFVARAQADRVRRVGALMGTSADDPVSERRWAFQKRLEQLGWKIGANLQIEYRWAAADVERLSASVAEAALVGERKTSLKLRLVLSTTRRGKFSTGAIAPPGACEPGFDHAACGLISPARTRASAGSLDRRRRLAVPPVPPSPVRARQRTSRRAQPRGHECSANVHNSSVIVASSGLRFWLSLVH
jgi:hypothetical protein